MEKTKRVISLFLAVLMLATMVPTVAPVLKQRASAIGGDDSLTWDFEDTTTLEEARQAGIHMVKDELSPDKPDVMWKSVNGEQKKIYGRQNIIELLNSTHEEDKYIKLTGDTKIDSEWFDDFQRDGTIVIQSDKVIDLNGYTLTFYNEENIEPDQKVEQMCGKSYWKDGEAENSNDTWYKYTAISIEAGTTVVMDSSEKQSGQIICTTRLPNPFYKTISKYVRRDIFSVTGGNLVIFGGSFYAGKQQLNYEEMDRWGTLKAWFGQALTFGTKVAKYGMGISQAEAGLTDTIADVNARIKKREEEEKKKQQQGQGQGDASLNDVKPEDQKKKEEDNQKNQPTGQDNTAATTGTEEENKRNKTVGEKQTDADKKKEDPNAKPAPANDTEANTPEAQKKAAENNPSNEEGTAKENEKKKNQNQKPGEPEKITDAQDISKAKSGILDAVLGNDELGLMSICNDALNLVESIVTGWAQTMKCCTSYCLGTVVTVQNGGNFVSYGGNYYGYGATSQQRDGVIEVVKAPRNAATPGRAYIYGGEFYARGGANVFNIIRSNSTAQTLELGVSATGVTVAKRVMPDTETGGYEVLEVTDLADELTMEEYSELINTPGWSNDKRFSFVDTSQIQVRGGKFRTTCDTLTTGLTKNDEKPSLVVCYPGTVHLGTESFNKKFIRDGRIQIVDTFGDGCLVLLDDTKEKNNGELYHYRLFCSDGQLRALDNMDVFPNNERRTNVDNVSMHMVTDYNNADLSHVWPEDEENVRAPFSRLDRYFDFPIDGIHTVNYKVNIAFDDDDVYGEKSNSCDFWYYNVPESVREKLNELVYADSAVQLTLSDQGAAQFIYGEDSKTYTVSPDSTSNEIIYNEGKELVCFKKDGEYTYSYKNGDKATEIYAYADGYLQQENNYYRNIKTFTYKIYKVDPLSMENIAIETGVPGRDEPVKTLSYSTHVGALRAGLPLSELGIDYKRGEMYRVTLEVNECVDYGADVLENTKKYDPKYATCRCSIVFRCIGHDELHEYTDSYGHLGQTGDFTPLQLGNDLKTGDTVNVGTDLKCTFQARTGQVDRQARKIFDIYYQWYARTPGGEDILIAGTDHVVDNIYDAPNNMFERWMPGRDGYQYKNTKPLPENTVDWTCEDIHTYTHNDFNPTNRLWKYQNEDGTYTKSYSNNDIWASNKDTLYISEDLAGCDIYCKAIAINNWWPINYDRRQTFYSHVLHVPGFSLNVELKPGYWTAATDRPATVSVNEINQMEADEKVIEITYETEGNKKTYTGLSVSDVKTLPTAQFPNDFNPLDLEEGDHVVKAVVKTDKGHTYNSTGVTIHYKYGDLYPVVECEYAEGMSTATAEKPATFRIMIPEIKGLAQDETITEVTYWAQTHGKTFTGLSAKTLDEIPTAKFPTDFFNSSGSAGRTGDRSVRAMITTSMGREFESSYDAWTDFRYDIPATSAKLFIYSGSHFTAFDGIETYYVSNLMRNNLDRSYARMLPENATINSELIPNSNLFSTNPDVAYFDGDGKLHLGDAYGETVITLVGPNGAEQKVRIVNPVDTIEISGLKFPEVDQPLDFDLEVPEGAPYRVKRLIWYYGPFTLGFDDFDDSEYYRNNYMCKEGDVVKAFTRYHLLVEVESVSEYPLIGDGVSDHATKILRYTNSKGEQGSVVRKGDPNAADTYAPSPTNNKINLYYYDLAYHEVPENVVTSLAVNMPSYAIPYSSISDFLENSIQIVGVQEGGLKIEKSIEICRKGVVTTGTVFLPDQVYNLHLNISTAGQGSGYLLGNQFDLFVNSALYASREKADNATNSSYEFWIPIRVGTDTVHAKKLPEAIIGKDVELSPGETVNLTDCYTVKGVCDYDLLYEYEKNSDKDQIFIDNAAGTVTMKPQATASGWVKIYAVADTDNDGEIDVRTNLGSIRIVLKGSISSSELSTVTVQDVDPTGNVFNTYVVKMKTNEFNDLDVDFDAIDSTVVVDIQVTGGETDLLAYDTSRGCVRIKPTEKSATVRLIRERISPDSITSVNLEYMHNVSKFKINGKSAETWIMWSLDGVVFQTYEDGWGYYYNLLPNQKTRVYFKQGYTGKVYSQEVTIAGREYDIYIGGTQLTDENMYQFQNKGLSYDYDTDTLTLNNYTLSVFSDEIHDVIKSESSLKINVIGTNKLILNNDYVNASGIYVKNNLEITGTGTLEVDCTGDGWTLCGIASANTEINMDGGKIKIITHCDRTHQPSSIRLLSGNLSVLSGTVEINYENSYSSSEEIYTLVDGSISVYEWENCTFMRGSAANNRTAYTGTDFTNADEGYHSIEISVAHVHNYRYEVEDRAYIAENATCTNKTVYYKSCLCGAKSPTETFGGEEREAHEFKQFTGRAATYDVAGYTDYVMCVKCGFVKSGEIIPQLERPVAPPVPTGLAAASNAPGEITVSWNAAAHATRYDVYRMDAGDYVKIGSTAQTSYTDTGLTPGETYYYKLIAVNESELGELASAMSGAVSAKVTAAQPVTHTVTVTGGTASVSAAEKGATVTITASAAPEGKAFDKWEVVKGGITLADATANVTTFVMGDADVEVKATYKDLPPAQHSVTVVNGTASAAAAAKGTTIIITASAAPEGKAFDKWEVVKGGITLADATANVTTFVMGDENVEVKATYKDLPAQLRSITVTSGTADMLTAPRGVTVTVTALAAPEGKAFDKWEVVKGNITLADVTKTVTTFVMGDEDVEVKATYKDLPPSHHSVTVVNGVANVSSAAKGTTVIVTANAAPDGQIFEKWEIVKGGVQLNDSTSAAATFVMGDADVEVKAVYKALEPDAPLAPTAVTAKATDKEIILTWTSAEKADRYDVYRLNAGEYEKIASSETTTYTDKNVSAGNTYYYKVTAVNVLNGKEYVSGMSPAVGAAVKDQPLNEETVADQGTGVSVAIADGEFEGKVELKVEKLEGEAPEVPAAHVEDATTYDISLMQNGEKVQPKTTVTVHMPIPPGYNRNALKLYHILDDESAVDTPFRIEEDDIVFEASMFSKYVLVDTSVNVEPEGVFGDIDGDGRITASDARIALRMSVDIMEEDGVPYTEKQQAIADVDKDDRVTAADARLLLRKAVGLEVLSEGWAGPV